MGKEWTENEVLEEEIKTEDIRERDEKERGVTSKKMKTLYQAHTVQVPLCFRFLYVSRNVNRKRISNS